MNAYLAAPPEPRTTHASPASGRELADGGLRLFCFHHAGAGALTFARWRRGFDPSVCVLPVRLPGRETRLREPRITEASVLLDELDAQLGPLLDQPYALYGHSLGALVAYRFAQRIRRAGRAAPVLVGLGACPPPHLPTPLTDQHDLPDTALLAALNRYGTLPPYMFERPDWLRTLLSTMRDDLRLAASLRALDGAADPDWDAPLDCPLHVFAGTGDEAAPAAAVAEWRRWASGPFVQHPVPGGHFFVRDTVLPELLAAQLRRNGPKQCAAPLPDPST
ncbi:thioesterase domain-containing protein [Streptomyces sp. WMMB303]|uniref:thioesterase II family protein n=1 Tax=Streptomyces sp. WMMB303 TaxID=3034154 RepID=UPI0023EB1C99|nr:thioesterase domain-containing protein [Streptomyces sp. WMMB303]MDF4249994.1 alpha/beta fold hydrolase [Streptomyces sp. WMMB303]